MPDFTKKELLECVSRELQKRRENYPKWVKERKMKQVVADDQIFKMEAVYRVVLNAPESFFMP